MEITFNEENLISNEIDEYNSKVRAILINEENKILVCNYGKVYLLPGGSVDQNEELNDAITRELKEELGTEYKPEELDCFLIMNYYQRNYPKRDGTVLNRLIKSYYYIGRLKPIIKDNQHLTEKEKKGNFKLELINLEDLEIVILNNNNNNPRNIYFQKELLTVFEYLKNIQIKSKTKKKTK